MKFGVRSSEFGGAKSTPARLALGFLVATFLLLGFASAASTSEKWSGVDENVIERIAGEHGREAKEPLVNTDQGDLLLFLFLIAGAVGGFVAGYFWRMLVAEKAPKIDVVKQNSNG